MVYTEFMEILTLIRSCKKTKIRKKFNKFFINDLISEYEKHLETINVPDKKYDKVTTVYISLFQYAFSKKFIDIKGKQRLIKNGTFSKITSLEYINLINDKLDDDVQYHEMTEMSITKLFEHCIIFNAHNIFDNFVWDFFEICENKITSLYVLAIEYNDKHIFSTLMNLCISPTESDFQKLLKCDDAFVSENIYMLYVIFENIHGFSILQKDYDITKIFKDRYVDNDGPSIFIEYLNSVMINYPSKEVLMSLINICDVKWKTKKTNSLEYLPFDMTHNPSNKNIIDPYCLSEYVLNNKSINKKYEIHRTMLRKMGFITRNTDTNSKYTIEEKKEKVYKCLKMFNITDTSIMQYFDTKSYQILVETPGKIKYCFKK